MSVRDGNWIEGEGNLCVRFSEEQGHLVKEWGQPDRIAQLEHISEQKKADKQKFLGGWKVGEIPTFDWYRIVLPKYPELISGDPQLARQALIKFSADPEMRPYMVARA